MKLTDEFPRQTWPPILKFQRRFLPVNLISEQKYSPASFTGKFLKFKAEFLRQIWSPVFKKSAARLHGWLLEFIAMFHGSIDLRWQQLTLRKIAGKNHWRVSWAILISDEENHQRTSKQAFFLWLSTSQVWSPIQSFHRPVSRQSDLWFKNFFKRRVSPPSLVDDKENSTASFTGQSDLRWNKFTSKFLNQHPLFVCHFRQI